MKCWGRVHGYLCYHDIQNFEWVLRCLNSAQNLLGISIYRSRSSYFFNNTDFLPKFFLNFLTVNLRLFMKTVFMSSFLFEIILNIEMFDVVQCVQWFKIW